MIVSYPIAMENNLLYTILILIYVLPLLAIDIVAYRILYLRIQLENEYLSYE